MQINKTHKILRISESGRIFDLLPLCDAKIRTDDGCTFDIHRVILARSSDYFSAMFCDMDKDRREFMVPGVSGECLSDIVCYVYTGDIRVTERNVSDLIIAADYLLLMDLQTKIKQCIKAKMTENNCLKILEVAHLISDEDMFQVCIRFIQTRFERLVQCQKDELADLPLEIFRTILSNRSLYVYNETTVWRAIVEWTQKDIPFRMCCVPQLLPTLAIEDMGEELATEILQHEMLSKNTFIRHFIELRSNDFTSNLDVFLSFLRIYSNRFTQPYSHRIPLNLHVIASSAGSEDEVGNSNLYLTYDENTDLWRKVTEVSFHPDFLIAIEHNIYIFRKDECKNFDLNVMEWVTMENFRHTYDEYCVVAIDGYIYILGQNFQDDMCVVEVYDTVNDRWFNGVWLPDIYYSVSVAIEKKIYLVGSARRSNGVMTQMFDPVTQHWSLLSPPIVERLFFEMVAYHQKIYLLGGSIRSGNILLSKAEVFDPATNLWKELPNMPYTYSHTKAVVFNDQIIVYDGHYKSNRVRWNDGMESWEKLNQTDTPKDLRLYRFCTIDDVNTIRMITKQNRDPKTHMEKSPFN